MNSDWKPSSPIAIPFSATSSSSSPSSFSSPSSPCSSFSPSSSPSSPSSPSSRMLRWKDNLFINVKELGTGGHGTVLVGEDSQTKEVVAIKIIKQGQIFRREVSSLRSLKGHPNIIEIRKAGLGKEHGIIFMEVGGGCDLAAYLQEKGPLSEVEARDIFFQMFAAVNFLTKNHICHHDIKLENFVFDAETNRVKLIDFGYSVNLKSMKLTEGKLSSSYSFCSPAYASKQVLFREVHDPEKTDVFGLGVCLYLLVTNQFPWCGQDDDLDKLKKNMLEKPQLLFDHDLILSDDVKELLQGMLQINENERWTLKDIEEHPWMKEELFV